MLEKFDCGFGRVEEIAEKLREIEKREEQNEEEEEIFDQEFDDFAYSTRRFQKSLYYGGENVDEMPSTSRFSMSVTKIAVREFNAANETRLDRLDEEKAAKLSKATSASPTALILALLYLERLRKRNKHDYLNSVSGSDLFLVSLLAASKYLNDDGEDEQVFNNEWAEAVDLDLEDLNAKEIGFLEAVEWRLYVTDDDFRRMRRKVERDVAVAEVRKRKWATYTDLMSLINGNEDYWREALRNVLQMTTICATAYAAGVVAILGAFWALDRTPIGPGQLVFKETTPPPPTTVTTRVMLNDTTDDEDNEDDIGSLANWDFLEDEESLLKTITSSVLKTLNKESSQPEMPNPLNYRYTSLILNNEIRNCPGLAPRCEIPILGCA